MKTNHKYITGDVQDCTRIINSEAFWDAADDCYRLLKEVSNCKFNSVYDIIKSIEYKCSKYNYSGTYYIDENFEMIKEKNAISFVFKPENEVVARLNYNKIY